MVTIGRHGPTIISVLKETDCDINTTHNFTDGIEVLIHYIDKQGTLINTENS